MESLAHSLEAHVREALEGVGRVDRISFRVKSPESFARKATKERDGGRKYMFPFADIEDQVAGRVLVFFRRDIAAVVSKLGERLNRIEQQTKGPTSSHSFAYESEHIVFSIPPVLYPPGWLELDSRPRAFELQVRTLFMHAWAEPQHDIEYKAPRPLTEEEERKLAWAASNAWGGDAIFEQLLDAMDLEESRRSRG